MLFPGQTSAPSLGLVSVEAWVLAGALYLLLAAIASRAPNARAVLGFAAHLRDQPEVPPAQAPAPGTTG